MLVSTKLHCPLTAGRLTQRERLDQRLDESLVGGCSLALVVAPAGFGKSTLVSAWLRNERLYPPGYTWTQAITIRVSSLDIWWKRCKRSPAWAAS